MPSLKLSNPFRRADGRPSLKEHAAALKASAARVIGRKIAPRDADPFEGVSCPPGFVAYPFDKPLAFTRVQRAIHSEACKLLDIALAEYTRRCDLMGSDLSEEERSQKRKAIRAALRLDALAAATDAGAEYPALSEEAIEAGAQRLEKIGQSSLSYKAEQAFLAMSGMLTPGLLPSGELRGIDMDAAVARAASWRPADADDAELLQLGQKHDAAHAVWREAVEAYRGVDEEHTAFMEAAQARGGPTMADITEAEAIPGYKEGVRADDDAFGIVGDIGLEILKRRPRSIAGLAVLARALVPLVWPAGTFEEDAALAPDEDMDRESVRHMVEACCAAAGVDWKGEGVPHAAASIAVAPAGPPMVDELLDGWAEWTKTDGTGASDADWERNAEMRDALLDRAAALPANRANMPAKAIAQSWLEYVAVWERDKPRDSYGIEGGLCIAIDEALRLEVEAA